MGTPLTILIGIVVIGTSIWVYTDAQAIGVKKGQIAGLMDMNPLSWFLACLLLWIVSFPFYLAYRKEFMRINGKLPKPSSSTSIVAPAATMLTSDFDDQLRKLAKLRDEKIISEAEFEQKKRAILGVPGSPIQIGQ